MLKELAVLAGGLHFGWKVRERHGRVHVRHGVNPFVILLEASGGFAVLARS